VLDTDETFTYTFTKPGTYSYFCSIHPKMTGKIVVQ
jgi:plastocyanin